MQDSITYWLAFAPVWLIAILTFGLSLLAAVFGEWLGRRRASPPSEDDITQEGYIVSGVVGLLALLLGFTFSLAVDRYDTRRMLVLEEANAIRTAYLQGETFAEPHRARLQGLLSTYIDNRLALANAPERLQAARLLAASHDLQDRLWEATVAAVTPGRDDVAAAFMESVSNVIAVGTARRTARETHVPPRVFVFLFFYLLMSAMVLGLSMRGRRRVAVAVLLALTGLCYVLIIDIDSATRGGVREEQLPMEELRASIRQEAVGGDHGIPRLGSQVKSR